MEYELDNIFFSIIFLVQITTKCLLQVLELQHLKDLVLEGCFGIDDDSLTALKHGCTSLEVFILGASTKTVSGHILFPYTNTEDQ